MNQFLRIQLLIYLTLIQFAIKINTIPVKDMPGAMKFLNRFGYLSDKEMAKKNLSMSDPTVQLGLKIFQRYAGISTTGTLNSETMEMMSKPRCGNKDMSIMRGIEVRPTRLRTKRYSTHSSWTKSILTYQLLNYPKCCVNVSTVDAEIAMAFKLWEVEITSKKLKIRKREITDPKADIEIKFTKDIHEDNLYFGNMEDMYGRATAHAFYPLQDDPNDEIRGDIHFNDKEDWTSGTTEGQNFLHTATHEIGHSLGLEHSKDKRAVMYYRVLPYNGKFKLHADDAFGIQKLYDSTNEVDGDGRTNMEPGLLPRGTVSRLRPGPRTQDVQIVSTPPPSINQKKKGWHCQKMFHNFGNTVMIAEQCLGEPDDNTEQGNDVNEIATS